jgi:hypothetical protein
VGVETFPDGAGTIPRGIFSADTARWVVLIGFGAGAFLTFAGGKLVPIRWVTIGGGPSVRRIRRRTHHDRDNVGHRDQALPISASPPCSADMDKCRDPDWWCVEAKRLRPMGERHRPDNPLRRSARPRERIRPHRRPAEAERAAGAAVAPPLSADSPTRSWWSTPPPRAPASAQCRSSRTCAEVWRSFRVQRPRGAPQRQPAAASRSR